MRMPAVIRGIETPFFCSLIAFMVLSWPNIGTGEAGRWPDWRGPTHQGHSDAVGLPLQWSETKNVVWKTPIHDLGYSTPVIWDDQIWLTTATRRGQVLYAICVDLDSGRIVHDIEVFRPEKPQRGNQKNSYATPSAVVEEGFVYVHYGTHGTACIDTKTGAIVWRRDDLNCDHLQGAVSSPLLYGDLLIVPHEGTDVQFTVALDKKTGRQVWRYDRPRDLYEGIEPLYLLKSYHTPVVVEIDGKPQLINNGAMLVTGHEPRTGKELWRVRYRDDNPISRVISGCGHLFINAGGSPGASHLLAVRQGVTGDVTDTHVAWTMTEDAPHESSPVLVGDLLYLMSDKGVLNCKEAATGRTVWTERLEGNFGASLLVAGNRIYMSNKDGKTTVIEPGRAFKVLAVNELDAFLGASPAVAGKSLIMRSKTHLYRLEQAGSESAAVQSGDPVIWDDRPATKWDTAYPVGNGRLGAMPWGQFPQEKILINEETIWARKGGYLMAEDSFKHLEEVRRLEAAGDYGAADGYFEKHIETGERPCSYQLLGWLNLSYLDAAPLQRMHRELDLATGVALNRYSLEDGTEITQRVWASAPDDVIGVTITANRDIGLRVSLDGSRIEDGDLVKTGAADGEGATQFVGRARALPAGRPATEGDALLIRGREITVYLSAATNFNRRNSHTALPEGWQAKARRDLDALRGRLARDIEGAAIGDHGRFFDRLNVDLGRSADAILALPTRDRLRRIKEGKTDDPDLIETYFQFGRYLLIASSRPGCFPANLQGVWNPHEEAPWGSDYHLNINIQMNYWHAETTNLPEMHGPLFDLIQTFQPNGREMARRLGMQGWCMGHSTDIWGHARIMSRTAFWGGSFFGGQWTTFHILEHYRFNRDRDFLARNWDVLTASAEFVASWLIPGPEEGQLMSRPTCSPENSFLYTDDAGKEVRAALSSGNTFDQFMVLQVFSDYLEAAEALGKQDDPFVKQVRDKLVRVYRPRIAEDGRLMEWRLPFKENEPGHRHMSHVIGAYPGNQINLDRDPALRNAVMKSIEGRLRQGGAGTGWSRAWTIGMFARLSDAERAYENLIAILKKSTLENLWDNHPPFQIDGNFGACAAVAEMLLHSHNDEIKLLPALPEAWPDGHARGLRARGDVTVDIQWKDGALHGVTLHAGQNTPGGPIRVVYQGRRKDIEVAPGRSVTLSRHDLGGAR